MDQSRRRFLSLFKVSFERRPATRSGAESHAALSQGLGPVIDARLCCGCDACAAVCDDGAIVLDRSGSEVSYLLRSEACSACNACVAVCDAGAASLADAAIAGNGVRIWLNDMRCARCGIAFHWPVRRGDVMEFCPVCASRRQPSRQVRS